MRPSQNWVFRLFRKAQNKKEGREEEQKWNHGSSSCRRTGGSILSKKAGMQLMGLFKCCRHKTDRHRGHAAVSLLPFDTTPNRVIFAFVHPGPWRLLHKSNTGRLLHSLALLHRSLPSTRTFGYFLIFPCAFIGSGLKKFSSKRSLWKLG